MRRAPAAFALLLASSLAAQSDNRAAAVAAYERKDFATCAAIYDRLGDRYNAACCFALAGNKDAAFALLEEVLTAGWSNTKQLRADPDLASLHDDRRWNDVIALSEKNWKKKFGDDNRELWSLREGDEADRQSANVDRKEAIQRDRVRLARVKEIIAAGAVKTANDHFMAAMLLQHGTTPDDYRAAGAMALRAAELDPENKRAAWLAAAAEDRYLWSVDKPQKYGTQFKQVDGVWTIEPIDATVTDAERAKRNVPPLAEAKRRADAMNQKKP